MEENKSYRIRTKVGTNSGDNNDNVINISLDQTYDTFEILSLKLTQENNYKLFESDYGIVVGRVLANGGFGIPNAKVSIFIESDETDVENTILYPYHKVTDTNNDLIRYNLLPNEEVNECHQNVGTFPNKRFLLDNDDIIEIFDKYWKYTTTTNKSGDYMLFGIPKGNQTLHVDIDLSDIGILSQRPRDMIYKGYDINQFESPNKFKKDTNLDSLSQIQSQNIGVYVYPYWGDTSNENNIAITRCDVQIPYKFEPTCVFMGSIITDTGSNAIGKSCGPAKKVGKMSEMTTGEGTIEMIRKTMDGKTEEVSIKGNRLIDGDGVWCYQIPMNLDYVITDEFGNIVPTDDPSVGIATRTRVRFRVTLDDAIVDNTGRKRCRYLIPNNPKFNKDFPIYSEVKEPDYEFGTNTLDESYRDLLWNNVYSVKNYIPNLQKSNSVNNGKHTGIKWINHYGNNNPMPYNSLTIKFNFTYKILCVLTKVIIFTIAFINTMLSIIMYPFCQLCRILTKICRIPIVGQLAKPLKKFFCKLVINCIKLSSDFCDDGVNKYTYYPGCGPNPFGCIWDATRKEHYNDERKLKPEDKTLPLNKPLLFSGSSDSPLITCVENSLAQEFEATSFNFSNDWVNGVLYAPMWFRKITPKKSYFFGLFRKRAKDQWCSWKNEYGSLKIFKSCAVKSKVSGSKISVEPQCGNSCGKLRSSIDIKKGLVVDKETMLGQTVYYYKPTEYNDKFRDSIMLFATDIILLGNLNKENMNGTPQFFKSLESTTYKLPYDVVYTDTDVVSSQDEQGNISYVIDSDVEMTGCDWGNINKEQECGKAKDGDSGLFYGIGCFKIEMKEKSCINASRICEFGVSLDESKLIPNLNSITQDNINDDKSYGVLIPDGFVSYDELYNLDERSMFATMNSNNLRTRVNTKNGLLEYDFNYTYVDNFDGSMYKLMKERQLPCDDKYTYKHNYNLELGSKDYIKFRYGSYTPRFYDSTFKSFPYFENSFYFYFGLNNGKTALDKFNYQFFSECKNEISADYSLNNDSLGNSWCKDRLQKTEVEGVYTNERDGYIKLDLKGITLPFNITLRCLTEQFPILKFKNIDKDKLYIGCIENVNSDEEREKISFDGYYNLYEFIDFDTVNEQFIKNHIKNNELTLDNNQYTFMIEDEEENNNEIVIDYYYYYLTSSFESQNFRLDNEALYNKFSKSDNEIKGEEITNPLIKNGTLHKNGRFIPNEADSTNQVAFYNIAGNKKLRIEVKYNPDNIHIGPEMGAIFRNDISDGEVLKHFTYKVSRNLDIPENAKILALYYKVDGKGIIEDFKVYKVIDKTYEAIAIDREGWTDEMRDKIETEDIEFNNRQIGGMVTVYDLFYLGKPLTENFKIEIQLEDPNKLPEYSDYYAEYKIYGDVETPITEDGSYFGKVKYYSRNIVSDNNDERLLYAYYFGVPKGGIEYKVTITFLCVKGNEAIVTGNKIVYTVLVKEPIKYRMFINGIDYELIKNFKTGWESETSDKKHPNISIGRIKGWDNLSELGGIKKIDINNLPTYEKIKEIFEKLMVSTDGDIFLGEATPDTKPDTSKLKDNMYYTAYTDGVYSNFDSNIILNKYDTCIIKYIGGKWVKMPYKERFGIGSQYNWTEEYRYKPSTLYYKFLNHYDDLTNDELEEIIFTINNVIDKRIDIIKEIKKAFYITRPDEEKELIVTVITDEYPIEYRICYNGETYEDCSVIGYQLIAGNDTPDDKTDDIPEIDKYGEYVFYCDDEKYHILDDSNLWFQTENNIVTNIMIPTIVGDLGKNKMFYRFVNNYDIENKKYDYEGGGYSIDEYDDSGRHVYGYHTYSFPMSRVDNTISNYQYKKPYFIAVKNDFDKILPNIVKKENWEQDTFRYSYIKNNLFGIHFIDKELSLKLNAMAYIYNGVYFWPSNIISNKKESNIISLIKFEATNGDKEDNKSFKINGIFIKGNEITFDFINNNGINPPFISYYNIIFWDKDSKKDEVAKKVEYSYDKERFKIIPEYDVYYITISFDAGWVYENCDIKLMVSVNDYYRDGMFIKMNGFMACTIINGIASNYNNTYTKFNTITYNDNSLNFVTRSFKKYNLIDETLDSNGIENFDMNNTLIDDDTSSTYRFLIGYEDDKLNNNSKEYPNFQYYPDWSYGISGSYYKSLYDLKENKNRNNGYGIILNNENGIINIIDEKDYITEVIYGSLKVKASGIIDSRTEKEKNTYKYMSDFTLTCSDTNINTNFYLFKAYDKDKDGVISNLYPLNGVYPIIDTNNIIKYFEFRDIENIYCQSTSDEIHEFVSNTVRILPDEYKKNFPYYGIHFASNNDEEGKDEYIKLYGWSIDGKFYGIDDNKETIEDKSLLKAYYAIAITDNGTKAISPVYDISYFSINMSITKSKFNGLSEIRVCINNLVDRYYFRYYRILIKLRIFLNDSVVISNDIEYGNDGNILNNLEITNQYDPSVQSRIGIDSNTLSFNISPEDFDVIYGDKRFNKNRDIVFSVYDITGLEHIAEIAYYNCAIVNY